MKLLTVENVITMGGVLLGLALFYALGMYTELGDGVRYGAMIVVGVVLPMIATTLYSS